MVLFANRDDVVFLDPDVIDLGRNLEMAPSFAFTFFSSATG
jgi:hypothetical protein